MPARARPGRRRRRGRRRRSWRCRSARFRARAAAVGEPGLAGRRACPARAGGAGRAGVAAVPQLALSSGGSRRCRRSSSRPTSRSSRTSRRCRRCPAGQTVPQLPQLALSLWRLVQVPPQFVSPDWQESWQVPPEQICPAGHAVPQAPQLPPSVWSVGAGAAAVRLSGCAGERARRHRCRRCPAGHACAAARRSWRCRVWRLVQVPLAVGLACRSTSIEQVPFEHAVPAGQTVPQAPQLALSALRVRAGPAAVGHRRTGRRPAQVPPEQTLPAGHDRAAGAAVGVVAPVELTQVPLQLVNPAWQESEQTLATHTSPAGQTLPQLPQLLRSLWRS